MQVLHHCTIAERQLKTQKLNSAAVFLSQLHVLVAGPPRHRDAQRH